MSLQGLQKALKNVSSEKEEILELFNEKGTGTLSKEMLRHLAFLYEMICALEKNEITGKNILLWKDLDPDIKDEISFPSEDVGIDLIDPSLSYLGQVKHYQSGSYVPAEHVNRSMLCFYHLKMNSNIPADEMEFLTPRNVKLNQPKLKYNKFLNHQLFDDSIIEKWIDRALDYEDEDQTFEFELRKCQKEALKVIREKWGENTRIEMMCGTGKTRLICEILQEKEEKIVILVPRVALLEQWSDELNKLEIEHSCCSSGYQVDLDSRIIICVYNSFEKLIDLEVDELIIDEAHHFEKYLIESDEDSSEPDEEDSGVEDQESVDSETRNSFLELIAEKTREISTIFLSATLTGDVDYSYSLEEGIADKVLCDYQIHLPVFSSGKYENALIEYLHQHPEFL